MTSVGFRAATFSLITLLSSIASGCSGGQENRAIDASLDYLSLEPTTSLDQLAGLEMYCREKADSSQLLQRFGISLKQTMAEYQFLNAPLGGLPTSLRVAEQHGQIQSIWLEWPNRDGALRQDIARRLSLSILADDGTASSIDETDYKTVYFWRAPTPKTASISLTCGASKDRERCWQLHLECVEYYQ